MERNFPDQLVQMAKFRNHLIHPYRQVDNEEVCQILVQNIKEI